MQKKTRFAVIITVVSGLLSLASSILVNVATSELPTDVKPYLQYVWPLLGIVALAALISTSLLVNLSTDTKHSVLTLSSQNRQRMLMRVHIIWINGVLEQSLHGTALITLELHEQPDAVANPWRFVFQQPNQPAQPLPPGTHIIQAYDDSDSELLILGEPGSGKTTLLLELTRELLKRADNDDHPIPVVFNLSSWAVKQQPLAEWLIEELRSKYQVPRKIGQPWIESDQILPLLDGLDEVAEKARAACVDAINIYREEHGLLPIVVCSRSAEYNDLVKVRHILQLHSAVRVQPLTERQIDEYLSSTGEQLAAVRVVLSEHKTLREMATTPLMLDILTLTFRGKSTEEILGADSVKSQQQQILMIYTEQMLKHRRNDPHFPPQRTIQWLTWLAGQLLQHNQTEFHIERLQPDWLPDIRLNRLYLGIIVGLVSELFLTLFCALNNMLLLTLLCVLGSILFFGLLLVVFWALNAEIEPTEIITWSWRKIGRNVIKFLVKLLRGWFLILLCSVLVTLVFWLLSVTGVLSLLSTAC